MGTTHPTQALMFVSCLDCGCLINVASISSFCCELSFFERGYECLNDLLSQNGRWNTAIELCNCPCLCIDPSALTSKVLRVYDHFPRPRKKSGDLEMNPPLCTKWLIFLFRLSPLRFQWSKEKLGSSLHIAAEDAAAKLSPLGSLPGKHWEIQSKHQFWPPSKAAALAPGRPEHSGPGTEYHSYPGLILCIEPVKMPA